ncbi:hypothetical protein EI74_0050 [Mycoplasma testudineum]|uniref:Lipoprotein n=2 Tax=Mycoplasma testudineum TaxID=244584 RepID=A0A4R6IJJ4_9MOLU|nr:hypothetical protein EI74_0050 [Mycoplasma testudineum]
MKKFILWNFLTVISPTLLAAISCSQSNPENDYTLNTEQNKEIAKLIEKTFNLIKNIDGENNQLKLKL